jgi:hypothetical protein
MYDKDLALEILKQIHHAAITIINDINKKSDSI